MQDYQTNFVLTLEFHTLEALNDFREQHLQPKKEKRGSKTAQRHSATREFLYSHPDFTYKQAFKLIGETIKLDNIAVL